MSTSAKQTLNDAINLLIDEHDENPRHQVIRGLQQLIDAQDDLPTGDIELTAIIKPNGEYQVHDQHNRNIKGVKSVAVFLDQTNAPVFQVNL